MGDYLSNIGRLVPNIDVGFAASMLSDVFGVNSPIYFPYMPHRRFKVKDYEIPDKYNGFYPIDADPFDPSNYDRLSVFGTPVFGSFTIAGGSYKVYDRMNGQLVDKRYNEFEFPLATLIEFRRSKVITKTPTVGGAGSVKEIYGMDDWSISIKGICMDDPSRSNSRTAIGQKISIIALDEIAGSLEIDSMNAGSIFLEKNINRIVIEDVSIGAIQGKPNMIPFEITASSDEDILMFV